MSHQRLFYALWPDTAVVQALDAWAHQAQALCGGRIMRPDTLHLTLAFLGPVANAQIPALQALLTQERWPGGRLQLDCYGRFRGPRIVWAGATVSPGWLGRLHQQLWQHLDRLGHAPPAEPFRPHVSLLRRAGPQDTVTLPPPAAVPWTVRELRLVASRPQETGSFYTVLARAPVHPDACHFLPEQE